MSVVEKLSLAIAKWLESKPKLSLNVLSRLANVSYSSVRRCAQKENEPTQEVVLSIAAIVLTESDYRAFVAEHYPNLKTFVTDLNRSPLTDPMISEFIKSEQHLRILVLASGSGIDENDVRDKFGTSSLVYFEELINSGFMTKKESKWVFDLDFGVISFEVARKWIACFLGMYDKRCDEVKGAAASYAGWESFNEAGAMEAHALTLDYLQKMYKLAIDPNKKGDIAMMFGTILNVVKGMEKLK